MPKPITTTLRNLLLIMATIAANPSHGAEDAHPRVLLQTSQGNITVELDRAKAPVTVDNFLAYVREGFYDGTIFHRVIKNFMIQGGGMTADFDQKPTHPPIKNEADNGLKNERGTIAMARTSNPHSATAQFFINTVDNDFLNFRDPTQTGWGYTVFGKVVDGMDTVDKISDLPTGSSGPIPRDVPKTMVTIEKVTLVSPGDKPAPAAR
jgi:cyclophilin family peptidyl-prolyl cis-trans isomerase